MTWYVVHVGKVPSVYTSWAEAHAQVDAFKSNCYKKFNTRNEAWLAFYGHLPEDEPLLQPLNPPVLAAVENDHFPLWHIAVKFVIVVVVALLVGFLIWK
jgi:hypothetical protein